MANFGLDGFEFEAEACINGVLVNPALPASFDHTPNEDRMVKDVERWAMRPFIVTARFSPPRDELLLDEWRHKWETAWPTGVRYDVRCLDFGAWDRSTSWGSYPSLENALQGIRDRKVIDFREISSWGDR
ncbi:hypothetical protein [Acidovorax sp. sic0104]|uniref:hypothetical protein n=1 Tax=Acidovorax sp. sic0104 TaxID=2854784 RepID=UPI001C44E3F8|nr:hypothetical protein [Acidovorax sp. sic0104]MBV7541986.1 hypothetical protein [Acidovorax sp. sic0104]